MEDKPPKQNSIGPEKGKEGKEAESLGAIFLLKPFDIEDLYKAIEKIRPKKK